MTAPPILQVQKLPPHVVTLEDHAHHAHTHLDANAWAYFSGGAGDEITLRANRSAWDTLQLHPRVLRSMAGASTRTQLLGRTLEHPILLAPIAFQRMAHPDGELATAYAASAQVGVLASKPSKSALWPCASVATCGDTLSARFTADIPAGSRNPARRSRSRAPLVGASTVRTSASYPAASARCTNVRVKPRSGWM